MACSVFGTYIILQFELTKSGELKDIAGFCHKNTILKWYYFINFPCQFVFIKG